MTIQEVHQEFTLRLLEAVDRCDKKIHAAYEERQLSLQELNEWLKKAWKEV